MSQIRFAPLLLLLVSACSLEVVEGNAAPPQLRVVNAAPSTSRVDVHLNGAAQSITPNGLAFRDVSDCLLVLNSSHQVGFVENGSTLASTTSLFENQKSYMVVLVNAGTTYRALTLPDDESVAAGSVGVRVINASASAADVYITSPGADPSPATKVAGNLAPLATTNTAPPFFVRPETDVRVRVYDVGSTTNDRADLTLGILSLSRRATVVITDRPFSGHPGAMQVNACR